MNWIGDGKKLLEDTHAKVSVKFLQSTKIASGIRTIFRCELSIVLGDFKLFKNSGIMLQENVYTCEFHDPSSRTKGPHHACFDVEPDPPSLQRFRSILETL